MSVSLGQMEGNFGPYETITKLVMYHFFISPPCIKKLRIMYQNPHFVKFTLLQCLNAV